LLHIEDHTRRTRRISEGFIKLSRVRVNRSQPYRIAADGFDAESAFGGRAER
jgi:hypothetical protein